MGLPTCGSDHFMAGSAFRSAKQVGGQADLEGWAFLAANIVTALADVFVAGGSPDSEQHSAVPTTHSSGCTILCSESITIQPE
jgi:hypothetical protein